jgi:hypothetical protein
LIKALALLYYDSADSGSRGDLQRTYTRARRGGGLALTGAEGEALTHTVDGEPSDRSSQDAPQARHEARI